jgi:pimeloyl-ACP methyl ester carboxylesterase
VIIPLGAYLRDALTPLGANHTLVFYDPRNRGRSDVVADTDQATFANDVADLEAVRSRLGISRVSLIGFSYFGAVVAAYAAVHPERVGRAVLMSPIEPTDSLERAFDPPERRTRIDTAQARALVKLRAAGRDTADATAYCTEYWRVNAPLFVSDTARASRPGATWCQFPNEAPRAMGAQMARVMNSLGPKRDFTVMVGRIRAPLLVMYGDRDLVVNPAGAREWVRAAPEARAWPVRGAGHFIFLEQRDAVIRVIDRFLKGEWPQ